MEQFHSSELGMGAKFRDAHRVGLETEHINKFESVLTTAMQKHGHEALTRENYDEVVATMQKDPHWAHTYSAGPKMLDAIKARLKI